MNELGFFLLGVLVGGFLLPLTIAIPDMVVGAFRSFDRWRSRRRIDVLTERLNRAAERFERKSR